MRKRLLFLLRQDPLVSDHLVEAIDAALVAAAFDQEVALLFKDAGVRALVPPTAETEGLTALLESLPDYEIEQVYVCGPSLARQHLSAAELTIPARALDPGEQQQLMSEQHAVLND